ncbi:ester cyclase [Flavitalea flava]
MKNFLPFFLSFLTVQSCSSVSTPSQMLMAKVDSLQNELNKHTSAEDLNQQRLTRFDSLDFDIYSNQKWDELSVSHSDNIVVYYPDGSTTIGLDPQHIDALKPIFVFAPDTKIQTHPVRVAGGDWTAVIGVMEGTFSQPMPMGKGRFLKPTGRKFKLKMCTVGHWKGDKMAEEYLFWDNAAFMKQIGAGS